MLVRHKQTRGGVDSVPFSAGRRRERKDLKTGGRVGGFILEKNCREGREAQQTGRTRDSLELRMGGGSQSQCGVAARKT